MIIKEIHSNKKEYLNILLIGDEDEDMIDKYLDESRLFVLFDNNTTICACAVIKIDDKTVEIKNLATVFEFQNKGFASRMLDFIFEKYKNFEKIILGTGENEKTLNFYKKRGFFETGRIKNFFTDNYKKPIFENGKQLVDMIYLEKKL